MKLLHQLGHKHNWSLDAFFQNKIGDGFILCAYSFDQNKIGKSLSGYESEKYMPLSFVDLEYYASKESKGKNLETYEFHPINLKAGEATEVAILDAITAGIKYQQRLNLDSIIIPNIYEFKKQKVDILQRVNDIIKEEKKSDKVRKYFMTIPISGSDIRDSAKIELLLQDLTSMDKVFDGYYVVCDSNLETRKKISVDFNYYINLFKVFKTLKKQGFITMFGLANIDALVFEALTEIDYISIGTYETQRKFDIKRFTASSKGGPSDGWYYSEKLLNFIRARELDSIRLNNCLDVIANEDNIFSDVILREDYEWNTHKPEVHKNTLVALSRQLKTLSEIKTPEEKIIWIIDRIESAKLAYSKLEENNVILGEESNGYNLPTWLSAVKTISSKKL